MWKRLGKIFKGFISIFIKGIEQSNPKALLEAQREDLREKIAKFNTNLAKQAGAVAKLERMIAESTKKEQELLAKTQAYLASGNQDLAGQMALQLKTLKTQSADYKNMLENSKSAYADLLKTKEITVKEAKMKFDELYQKLSQVEMKEAEAELREMATAMVGEIGTGGDTMNRLEEQLNERLEQATGRALVARDSADNTEIKLKESEIKALESQALAELTSSLGIEYKSTIPVAGLTLEKEMGVSEKADAGNIRTMGPAELS